MDLLHQLIFASDAALLALWGAGFLLLAVLSMLGERRRMKRARIDRVGWVPWTGLFLASAIIGGGLLALAVPGIVKG
ncbi:hypothetical protein OAS19_04535 [Altererythrobacter sp.]|nr:hypothetical protein [Altererythrobacter sp.]